MTISDPCPWQTFHADGGRSTRYASEEAARMKARIIGGTYRYAPRVLCPAK